MNYQISNSKIKINPTGLVLIYTKNLPAKYSGILITRLAKKLWDMYKGLGPFHPGASPVYIAPHPETNKRAIWFSLSGVPSSVLLPTVTYILHSLKWSFLTYVKAQIWNDFESPDETFCRVYQAINMDARRRQPEKLELALAELTKKHLPESFQASEAHVRTVLEDHLKPVYPDITVSVTDGKRYGGDAERYNVLIENVPEEVFCQVKHWLEREGFWYFNCTDQPATRGYKLVRIVTKRENPIESN